MRVASARRKGLLELSEMRLPLIALIDVILFLLMYFLLAGSLDAEDRELAAAIAASARGTDVPGKDLETQSVEVVPAASGVEFRVGARIANSRDSLLDILRQLPHEPGVVVRVSDGVPVSAAALAVQTCRDAGFMQVSYQSAGAVKK